VISIPEKASIKRVRKQEKMGIEIRASAEEHL
jgi:hypothetical protein